MLWTLAVLLAGCSRPDDVLSESKMADVLTDLSIADQLALRSMNTGVNASSDSSLRIMRQSIMKKHGVTEAQFDSTLSWYGHHMDDYANLYKKVDQRLAKRLTELNKRSGVDDSDKDNLWPMPKMISISPNDLTHGFSFSLPGTKVQPGKALEWKLRVNDDAGGATAFLAAEYSNMEMIYTRITLNSYGTQKLTLQLENKRRPKRIIGYVRFSSKPAQRLFLDSLTLRSVNTPAYDYAGSSSSIIHLDPVSTSAR